MKFEISKDIWLDRKSKRLNVEAADSIEQKDIHEKVLEFFSNKEIFNEYTKPLNMLTYTVNADNNIYETFNSFKGTIDMIINN